MDVYLENVRNVTQEREGELVRRQAFHFVGISVLYVEICTLQRNAS